MNKRAIQGMGIEAICKRRGLQDPVAETLKLLNKVF